MYVFCQFCLISIIRYSGRCQKKVIYIRVVHRGALPSICDVHCPWILAKIAGSGGVIGDAQCVYED